MIVWKNFKINVGRPFVYAMGWCPCELKKRKRSRRWERRRWRWGIWTVNGNDCFITSLLGGYMFDCGIG